MQSANAEYLTFAIDDQRFAIRIDDVDEVVRAVGLARLPTAPRIVEGLIDLRGRVVPVIDIRSRFSLSFKPLEPADHFVIARARERLVGIRVDRAIDIRPLAAHEIDDIDAVTPSSDYISGVARLPDGLVLIHDLATLLSDAEAQTLDDLVNEGLPP